MSLISNIPPNAILSTLLFFTIKVVILNNCKNSMDIANSNTYKDKRFILVGNIVLSNV